MSTGARAGPGASQAACQDGRRGDLHRRGAGGPRALLHQPRRPGLRAGQPARGGQGRALRALLPLRRSRCAGSSSTSSSSRSRRPADARARIGDRARGSALRARASASTATIRWPSSAACTWPCEGASQHPDQGARVGPAHGLPRAVHPLRAVHRPPGRALQLPRARRAATGSPLRERYVEVLDRAFETYARWIDPMREYWTRRFPQPAGEARRRLPHDDPGEGARHSARAAARGDPVERGHLRHRPGLRGAPAPHARASARARCATTAALMLVELRKVIPAFLTAPRAAGARRASGRGTWRRRARPPPRWPPRLLEDVEPESPARGHADRLRSGRRGEGGGRRALRGLRASGRPAPGRRAQARRRGAPRGPRRLRRRSREPAPQAGPGVRAHRRTASTCSATTAPSATCSATGC